MRKIILFTVLLFSLVFLAACSSAEEPASSLVGTSAPDFSLENIDGSHTTLSGFQGKPVLLFFHMAVG